MLPLLAALIPIAGSLYVAGSVLYEQSRLADERRRRVRVQQLAKAHQAEFEAIAAGRAARGGDPAYMWAMQEEARFIDRMLGHHGLVGRGPTFHELDIDLAMSGPEFSVLERRRQSALLFSSVAGVILIALDSF